MRDRARMIPATEAGEWAFMSQEQRRERRRNSRLFEEEFEQIDDRVVQAAEERLAGIDDLRNAGLVRDVPIWVKVHTYRKISEMSAAEQTMTGRARSEADRTERQEASVPLPITFKDFEIERRELEASRQTGADFDDADAAAASRKVVELLEDNLFNGAGHDFAGHTLPGYTTFGDRNTISKAAGSSWDDLSLSNLTTIHSHVLEMAQALEDVDMSGGPLWLYVPTEFFTVLSEDYKSESEDPVIERLRRIPNLERIRFVDRLGVNNVVMVRAVPETVQLVVGNDIDTVDRMTDIDFLIEMKVWAAMAPQLKSDINNNSGIVHLTLQD